MQTEQQADSLPVLGFNQESGYQLQEHVSMLQEDKVSFAYLRVQSTTLVAKLRAVTQGLRNTHQLPPCPEACTGMQTVKTDCTFAGSCLDVSCNASAVYKPVPSNLAVSKLVSQLKQRASLYCGHHSLARYGVLVGVASGGGHRPTATADMAAITCPLARQHQQGSYE